MPTCQSRCIDVFVFSLFLSAVLNWSQFRSSATVYQWQMISWLSAMGWLQTHSYCWCNLSKCCWKKKSRISSTRWHCRTSNELLALQMACFIAVEASKSSFLLYLLSSFCSCSPEASAEPVPPSPGRWSQDLLSNTNGYEKRAFFSSKPPRCWAMHRIIFSSVENQYTPFSVARWGVP